MYDGLNAIGRPKAFCFIDFLCIRPALKGDFLPRAVSTVIGAIGHTLLLLCPYQTPWASTRDWCAFEIYHTVEAKAVFNVAP